MTAIGTRLLTVTIDGTEYSAEVSKAVFTRAESDSDFTTFFDARRGGGSDYFLEVIAVQDAATGSLWSAVFDNAGDEVLASVAPYGNEVPTVAEPHFSALITLTEPDGDFIGTEANKSTSARATIEAKFPCRTRPAKVTAPV